jgi:hypothetical protein
MYECRGIFASNLASSDFGFRAKSQGWLRIKSGTEWHKKNLDLET